MASGDAGGHSNGELPLEAVTAHVCIGGASILKGRSASEEEAPFSGTAARFHRRKSV
jgi:hypothetical protein